MQVLQAIELYGQSSHIRSLRSCDNSDRPRGVTKSIIFLLSAIQTETPRADNDQSPNTTLTSISCRRRLSLKSTGPTNLLITSLWLDQSSRWFIVTARTMAKQCTAGTKAPLEVFSTSRFD